MTDGSKKVQCILQIIFIKRWVKKSAMHTTNYFYNVYSYKSTRKRPTNLMKVIKGHIQFTET